MKYFLLIVFVFGLFACTKNKQAGENENVVYLSETDLPIEQKLNLEKIEIPEEYGASEYFVYQDSILIVNHEKYPNPYYITILNINTWDVIGQYLKRGLGPNELVSTGCQLNDNILLIDDYVAHRIIPFYVDSAIILRDAYKPTIHAQKCSYLYYNVLNDTTFIMQNPFYFDFSKEFDNSDSICEFYRVNNKSELLDSVRKCSSYYAHNLSGCWIATSQKENKIFCAYTHVPKIKILNHNLEHIKTYIGPESEEDTEYTILENEGNMLYFKEYNNNYFLFFTATKNNIFLLNGRVYKHSLRERNEYYCKSTAEIWHLNINGDIIARYSAKGYPIIDLSYSEKSNTLYIASKDENDELSLYKAKLE